jgi:hypothetical protein
VAVAIKVGIKHEIALQQKLELEFRAGRRLSRQKNCEAAFPVFLRKSCFRFTDPYLLQTHLLLKSPVFKRSEALALCGVMWESPVCKVQGLGNSKS